jgi:hypothetical protein
VRDVSDASACARPKRAHAGSSARPHLTRLNVAPFISVRPHYLFYSSQEGRSNDLILGAIRHDYVPLMIANWKIWPAVTLINFRFVPPAMQVLFANVVSVFWTVYVLVSTGQPQK